MKKDITRMYKFFKVCQLILLILFFVLFFVYLKTDPILSNSIFTNTKLLSICVFLWAFMVFSFLALVVDFKHLERMLIHNDDLNRIAYRDTLTGIPNRVSCDLIFQKYENREDISGLSAALISITNLPIINEALGRERGDLVIQNFASLLDSVASEYGFFGRNSGNEFLVIIEDCDEAKMTEFLNKLAVASTKYNSETEHMPVTYKTVTAHSQDLEKPVFNDLISQLYKSKG